MKKFLLLAIWFSIILTPQVSFCADSVAAVIEQQTSYSSIPLPPPKHKTQDSGLGIVSIIMIWVLIITASAFIVIKIIIYLGRLERPMSVRSYRIYNSILSSMMEQEEPHNKMEILVRMIPTVEVMKNEASSDKQPCYSRAIKELKRLKFRITVNPEKIDTIVASELENTWKYAGLPINDEPEELKAKFKFPKLSIWNKTTKWGIAIVIILLIATNPSYKDMKEHVSFESQKRMHIVRDSNFFICSKYSVGYRDGDTEKYIGILGNFIHLKP